MKQKIGQLLFVFIIVFTTSQVILSQDSPEDIVSYSYAESWWDVKFNQNTYASVSEPNFTGYANSELILNTQVTTDFNIYSQYSSYGQCQWNQNMKLLDMSINQLVAQTGSWTSGNTTYSWYEFGSNWGGGSYMLSAGLSMGVCPPEMPVVIVPEPIVIDIGYVGASMLRYDFNRINEDGKYIYSHMPGHEFGTCPAYCGNTPTSTQEWTVHSYPPGTFPGNRVRGVIPFGPLGCSILGAVKHNATSLACYDVSYN